MYMRKMSQQDEAIAGTSEGKTLHSNDWLRVGGASAQQRSRVGGVAATVIDADGTARRVAETKCHVEHQLVVGREGFRPDCKGNLASPRVMDLLGSRHVKQQCALQMQDY